MGTRGAARTGSDARALVLVEWIDSHSGSGWQPLDEIEKAAEPVHCRSVGWLVAEGNGSKVLVPHISGEKNGDLRLFGKGEITIPERAIVKVHRLQMK
jgi:hypothetical protein